MHAIFEAKDGISGREFVVDAAVEGEPDVDQRSLHLGKGNCMVDICVCMDLSVPGG